MAAGVVAAGLMGDEHARLSRGAGRCEPRRGRGSPRETGLRLGAPAALSQPHWQTQNDDDNWKTARLHGTPASLQHCHRHYQGRRYWGLGVLTPLNMSEGQSMLWPLKVTFFYSKLLLDNSASFKIIKDQKLVSKMKGKTNFSRRLSDIVRWLDLTLIPSILLQTYTTVHYGGLLFRAATRVKGTNKKSSTISCFISNIVPCSPRH